MAQKPLFERIGKAVDELTSYYREFTKDRHLSFLEIVQLLAAVVSTLVQFVYKYDDSGDDKKEAVSKAVTAVYDAIVPTSPGADDGEVAVTGQLRKSVLLTMALGLIDATVATFNQFGWPQQVGRSAMAMPGQLMLDIKPAKPAFVRS